jgi:hypothetical protein
VSEGRQNQGLIVRDLESREFPSSRRHPQFELLLRVQLQDMNGSTPDRRPSDKQASLPLEVLRPKVTARMKQFGQLAGLRIVASNVGTFVKVAIDAREREVVWLVGPTMLLWPNVLDVQGGQGRLVLVQPAVLAAVPRAPANEFTNCLIHGCVQ